MNDKHVVVVCIIIMLMLYEVDNSLMQIFVKVLTLGTTEDILTLDVEATDTISNVKVILAGETGLQPEQQFLFFNACQLEDSATLMAYGVKHTSTLEMVYKDHHCFHIHLVAYMIV